MLGMWPEDDIDPLTSPSDPEDKTSSLLQVILSHVKPCN